MNLTNVRKRAHAGNAWITLGSSGSLVLLTVSDNGVGLPSTGIERRAKGHLELAMQRDGVELVGGQFEVSTRPGGGTQVTVRLPMNKQSDEPRRKAK